MNITTEHPAPEFSEREEIEMLLPWYHMGTLEPGDRDRVERYLKAHPDMRAQLHLIEDERANTVLVNETLTVPHLLLNSDTVATATGRSSLLSRLVEPFAALLPSVSPAALRFAAAGLMAVVIGQAVAIGWLATSGRDDSGYSLATGENGDNAVARPGTFALARIADDARYSAIAEELQAFGVTISDGPNSAGFVTLRLGPQDMPEDEVDALVARLKSQSRVIQFLLPRSSDTAN